jgi:predicted permease
MLTRILSLVRNLVRKRAVEQALDDELRSSVELLTEEKMKEGYSPSAARREALIELGGVEQVKEEVRAIRAGRFLEDLARDTRLAFRTLAKSPGFTAAIVISLALGIGANATVFSVANGLLWGVLPIKEPGRMVTFSEGNSFSYPDFIDYRGKTAGVFEGVSAHFPFIPASLGGVGEPERVWGQTVSGGYFPLLGVNPLLGRFILPEEDQVVGRDAVVVLSNDLWKRRFGSDPGVLGRSVLLNGQPFTVVGVASAGFYGTDHGIVPDFWAPLAMTEALMPDIAKDQPRTNRDSNWLILNARLKPSVSRAQAVAAANLVKKRIDDTYYKGENRRRNPITLQPAGGLLFASDAPALTLMAVLMVVVGLVLMVACANVANLLLARATERHREVAIRLAIGASRGQLIRQMLTESLLLALAGALVGFLVASIAARTISRFQLPLPLPIVFDFTVNWRVVAFTAGLSLLTALLFGLAPALRATRPDLAGALKNEPAVYGRGRRFGMRNTLVVVQVALSLVLLASAGLFLRSLQNASSIDIGMKPDNVLLMTFDPQQHKYPRQRTQQLLSDLRQRVSALPGVRSVTFADSLPLSIGGTDYGFRPQGTLGGQPQYVHADVYNVGSGFFESLGIPLLRGRDFARGPGDEHALIINETMAQRAFGNDDPLGRQMLAGAFGEKTLYTIIGVARNSKSRTLGEGAANCAYLFVEAAPENVFSLFGNSIVVKTSMTPMALARPVRDQIAVVDPNMAVFNTETMREHVDKSLLLPRICATLLGVFGMVGLTLAVIGLYGLLSYSVRRRTQEIGIRMALGARPGSVLKMVLGQGLTLTSVGLAIGLAIAVAVGRFAASLLYGISGTDRITFLTVPAVLLVAALVAIVLPARRAAKVDPVVALRNE